MNIIDIIVEPFKYNINFDKMTNQIYIQAIHINDFLLWKLETNNSFSTSTCNKMNITYSPKDLLDVFINFKNNRLVHQTIIFPETYQIDTPLTIGIVASIMIGKNRRITTTQIILDFNKLSNEKKYDLKLDHFKRKINDEIEQINLFNNSYFNSLFCIFNIFSYSSL